MLENFIYAKKKSLFTEQLEAGNILDEAIVFIEDSCEIWNHGTYFATPLTVEEIETIIENSTTKESFDEQIAALTTSLSEERQNRIDDVTVIHTLLEEEEYERTTADTTEKNRATAAEDLLQLNIDSANTAISNETNRAKAIEEGLLDQIDVEEARAIAAEADLTTLINKETERATAAESELSTRISDHLSTTDTALALKADKSDTYTKVQVDAKVSGVYKIKGSSAFESLPTSDMTVGDVYNITNDFTLNDTVYPAGTNVVYTEDGWDALSGVFDSTALEEAIQNVADNLSSETVRAVAAEQALSGRIDTEIANREAADSTLLSNIDDVNAAVVAEMERATDKENAINQALVDEVTRATTEEDTLNAAIVTEKNERIAALNDLNVSVDGKLEGYLPLSGGAITGNLTIKGHTITSTLYPASDNTSWLGSNNNRWADLRTVLLNGYTPITSGNYDSYALPLTGGTIQGGGGALSVNNTSGNESFIKILSGGTYKGAISAGGSHGAAVYNASCAKYLGIMDDGTPHFHGNTLWHSGNDGAGSGLGADTLDGREGIDFAYVGSANNTTSAYLTQPGLFRVEANTEGMPVTSNGHGLIHMPYDGNAATQIFSHYNQNKLEWRRKTAGTWYDWKTIAFTDSDITGNAATATKLQTARTIWGQSFDGTGNVSEVMTVDSSTNQIFVGTSSFTSGTVRATQVICPNLTTAYGVGHIFGKELSSYDCGNILFHFTAHNYLTNRVSIGLYGADELFNVLGNGNVGIGTTNPAYKLDVAGNISGDFIDWYGVEWLDSASAPELTRIGNMQYHKTLPILSAMKGYYIFNRSHEHCYERIVPLSDSWGSLAYPNSEAGSIVDFNDLFSPGNIMVKIPEYWYTHEYDKTTGIHQLKLSQTAKAGWLHHKEAYVGAYEGAAMNEYKSIKNQIPLVSATRDTLRSLARANGYEDEYKWNIYTYEEHRAICHLFMVEYATRNSQAAVNTELTEYGFKQGGLGSGCTTGTVTINGVTTYSFIPTGTTDSLGNGSGQVAYTVIQTDADGNETGTVTRYANRYRGIENPFGHVWKHSDDIISIYSSNTAIRTWYKCEKPEHFALNKNNKYKPLCSAPSINGYKKTLQHTVALDFFAAEIGAASSTYWCDYNYDNTDTSEHCLLIGGRSVSGGPAGLFYLYSLDGVSYSSALVGSRLTYLPWAE